MNSIRVRQITDGAIITALYAVFFLVSRFSGGALEYELFFLIPLFISFYAFKYNAKLAFIPLFATTLISIFVCSTPWHSLVYVLPGLLIGILFGGLLVKTKLSSTVQILIITLGCLVMEILSMYVISQLLNITSISEELNSFGMFISKYISLDIVILQALLDGIIPSILVILSLVEAVLIYLLFLVIVYKSKLFRKYSNKPKFSIVIAPIWLSILYLALIPFFIVSLRFYKPEMNSLHVLMNICINTFIILTLIYCYFGIKLSALFLKLKNKTWGIVFIYLLLFIPPFQLVLASIGVFDSFSKTTYKYLNLNNQNI